MQESKGEGRRVIRIMFVCHGNICRSTMAEFVMKDLVARAGLERNFVIVSRATHNDELGNGVHHGTRRVLALHGVYCDPSKRATKLKASDYDAFDLFIGMDEENMQYMRRMLGGDPQGKVHRLMEYAEGVDTESASDVADPWYTGDFETTYDDVIAGCEALLAWLRPMLR